MALQINDVSSDARTHNFSGSAAPTVNDDTGDGYDVGSVWIYGNQSWLCMDNSSGAAVWVETTQSAGTFGSEFQTAVSAGVSSTTSTTYQTKLTLTTGSLPSGTYKLEWSCEGMNIKRDSGIDIQVWDGSTELSQVLQIARLDYTSTPFYDDFSGHTILSGISGVKNFYIRYKEFGGDTAYIRNARLTIQRVS